MYNKVDYSKVDMVYAMEGYLDDSFEDIGLESLYDMTFDEIAMEGIADKLDEGLSKNRVVATVINFIQRCIEAIGKVLTKILPKVMGNLNRVINHGAVNVSSNVITNYRATSQIWAGVIDSVNAMKNPYLEGSKMLFAANTKSIDETKQKLEKSLDTLEDSIKASDNERSIKVDPSIFTEMMTTCKTAQSQLNENYDHFKKMAAALSKTSKRTNPSPVADAYQILAANTMKVVTVTARFLNDINAIVASAHSLRRF